MRIAAVVLAAGAGRRLAPLSDELPKALCPVNNVALLDHAFMRVHDVLDQAGPEAVAVNAHSQADSIVRHVGRRAHVSVERERALGTAGALAQLRDWIDGRDVLVTNADAWGPASLHALVEGWDAGQPRLLVTHDAERADFAGGWRFAGSSLLPWRTVRDLELRPSGLYEVVWRAAEERHALSFLVTAEPFVDCGTPPDYLRANLLASGGLTVVGAGAQVRGTADRCVLWPGAVVEEGEHLVECVRTASGLTVDARPG
jgi:N-acetyl-alpha-D-muramate 1-phosphate uridylyltransferase